MQSPAVQIVLFAIAAFASLTIAGVYALIPLSLAALWLSRQPFSALGFDLKPRRVVEFVAGLLLGSAMVATTVLFFRAFSTFRIEPNPKATAAVAITGIVWYLKSSLMEELLFRGYAFLRLTQWLGVPKAQAIAAIVFALWHVFNVGMPLIAALLLPGVASLLFGYAFLRTRGLFLPIAMHAAWNYSQEQFGIASGRNQVGLWTIVREPNSGVHGLLGYAILLTVLALAALAIRRLTPDPQPASEPSSAPHTPDTSHTFSQRS